MVSCKYIDIADVSCMDVFTERFVNSFFNCDIYAADSIFDGRLFSAKKNLTCSLPLGRQGCSYL